MDLDPNEFTPQDDIIPNVAALSEDDLAAVARARAGLDQINAAHATQPDAGVQGACDMPLPYATTSTDDSDNHSLCFTVRAGDLVGAVAATFLPPSDRPTLTSGNGGSELHKILITFERGGMRFSNIKGGTACELKLPVAALAELEVPRTIAVASAQLEALFNRQSYGMFSHEPYATATKTFSVRPRRDDAGKEKWALPRAPKFDRVDRPVTLSLAPDGTSFRIAFDTYLAELPSKLQPTPEVMPAPPEAAQHLSSVIASEVGEAIVSASTYSGLARGDDRWSVISIANGHACGGGNAGAFSFHESGLLDGLNFDLPVGDVRAIIALLRRIDDFTAWCADDKLFVNDGLLTASTRLASQPFPVTKAALDQLPPVTADCTVSLFDLHTAVNFVSVVHPREKKESPNHIYLGLVEQDEGMHLDIFAMAPGGDHGRAAVALNRIDEVPSEVTPLAVSSSVLRLACASNAATAYLKFLPAGITLSVERDCCQITHFISANRSVKGTPERLAANASARAR
ncbi:hypothetical protein [Parafrankia sp. BMG5.11]|uniref:hypothetical protein n=1 Tax=Parafrankia sp. BMG5.11 TaxID=222540 RepID=UPI001038FD06|nr:hypothetical protein [Parafrankia sp. BMG5.11]TCJ39521.1 hypothetical protein E0504_10470 [Parafrankia sp. BMG5.11]